jgi:orotidine-5'-phosphate decarboxylase
VFVLARTSNPEGGEVQLATVDGEPEGRRTVAQAVVDTAAELNAGVEPLGDIGVGVGATHDHGLDLSRLNGPVLAPGLGAQGAGPADLARRFSGLHGVVLGAASRSVLQAGPQPVALRTAALRLRDELAAARRSG